MRKKLALISTGLGVVHGIQHHVHDLAPELDVFNIVDDSIVSEISRSGDQVTPAVRRRMLFHVMAAEYAGADLALVTCSSVSEVVDDIAPLVRIPVLKIDEPMARQAVQRGSRVGVVATLQTTLKPTTRLLTRAARELGKEVEILPVKCDGAFEALGRGDGATHDRIIRDALIELAPRVDVIVLAQASMARVARSLGDLQVPVLTSPQSGVQAAVERLRAQ